MLFLHSSGFPFQILLLVFQQPSYLLSLFFSSPIQYTIYNGQKSYKSNIGDDRSNAQIGSIYRIDETVGERSSKPIEKDKKYFCVATWGSMHLLKCPKFMRLTSKIGTELHGEVHGEHLVGETRQVCSWGISDFRAETFTVWHEREAMATFYKSGAHKNAMESMKHDIDFRARRVWVTATDIPDEGDSASTKAFVLRVKRGDFPEA